MERMQDAIGPLASAFWGYFGTNREGPRHYRSSLFEHQIRKAGDLRLTVFYTLPPTVQAIDSTNVPPRYLFAGRPFFLQPGATALEEKSINEFLRNIDGKFRLLLARGDSIILATDIIGAGAVYYAVFDGSLFFGTHLGPLLEILPHCPRLNRLGVVSLLLSYGQLFKETHFAGVNRLQAGQFLEASWNPQQGNTEIRIRNYCELAEVLLQGSPTPTDPTALGELLRTSQAREGYDASTALMLSGGKDSKAIALTRPTALKMAISYGTRDSLDVRHAHRLTRKLGMKHYAVPYQEWNLDTYSELIIGLNAGCSGLQTSHTIVGFDWAREVCKLSVVGFADVLTGVHLRQGDRIEAESVRSVLLVGPRREVAEAFPEEVEAVNGHVASLFEQYKALPPAKALLIMDLRFRQATWISMTFDLCGWMTPVSYPFFYRPLMQMLFQLPVVEVVRQRLYSRWLARAEKEQRAAATRADRMLERLVSRYYYVKNGRLPGNPGGMVFWPDVIARTDPFITTRQAGVMEELDQLTQNSWREAVQKRANTFPLCVISIPIAAAFRRAEGLGRTI